MSDLDKAIETLANKGVDPKILRTILRDLETSPTSAQLGGFEDDNGTDSLPIQGRASPAAAEPPDSDRPVRLSRQQLIDLHKRLTPRDLKILANLVKYRFLFTNQIQRLFFTENESRRTNLINTNRVLKKLREYGVIAPLKRSIGGFKAGSSSMIWHLTEGGYRLLNLLNEEQYPRKRFDKPSTVFLAHTLAIAETSVQLTTICRASEKHTLKVADPEPSCWRIYQDDGKKLILKPDLYAVTTETDADGNKYEDSWFIEMDLGTESPNQVVEKCQAYLRYFNTGIEQTAKGVFPVVVWLVKDEARKERLRQYIREKMPPQPKLFLVITPDQLGKMVLQYLNLNEMC